MREAVVDVFLFKELRQEGVFHVMTDNVMMKHLCICNGDARIYAEYRLV